MTGGMSTALAAVRDAVAALTDGPTDAPRADMTESLKALGYVE